MGLIRPQIEGWAWVEGPIGGNAKAVNGRGSSRDGPRALLMAVSRGIIFFGDGRISLSFVAPA